jgi:hypothetical protein
VNGRAWSAGTAEKAALDFTEPRFLAEGSAF